jgi:uncharacterized membrane protein YeaQ/YmgE (transglycosylase-associated protein family)
MVITINGATFTLDLDTILIWALVGLVAGFLASHLALGHGLGLLGDIVVIIGAFIGGFLLLGVLHISIDIAGHPILTQMLMAFIGAAILLLIVRLFGGGRRSTYRRRAF